MNSREALDTLRVNSKAFIVNQGITDENDLLNIYHRDAVEELECEIKELEQYKAIEQELGIDLVTLFKLFNASKIYIKFFSEIQEYNKFKIDIQNKSIWYGYIHGKGYSLTRPLSCYGTSLALTREELENE